LRRCHQRARDRSPPEPAVCSARSALKASGANSNLFHQGAARESKDPDVVAAAVAKPGVVLMRPVGSDGPVKEHAELLTRLDGDAQKRTPKKAAREKERARRERAVWEAQQALNKARQAHEEKAGAIDAEHEALDERSRAEDARWEAEKGRLEKAVKWTRGRVANVASRLKLRSSGDTTSTTANASFKLFVDFSRGGGDAG
jgi:hypothetical protein